MGNWLVAIANNGPDDGCHWRTISEKGIVLSRGHSDFNELSSVKHDKFVLVLPGVDITALRVPLHAKTESQLRATAPFAIEDDIAADIETQHVSIGHPDAKKQNYTVTVIAKKTMDVWLESLGRAGLQVEKILPDYLSVPFSKSHVNYIDLAGRRVFRALNWGVSFDDQISDDLIGRILNKTLTQWDFGDEVDGLSFNNFEHMNGDGYDIIAQQAIRESYSLRQGYYGMKQAHAGDAKEWKVSFLLMVAVVLFAACYNFAQGISLTSETAALKTTVTQEIQRVFPGVKRVNNPIAQLKTLAGNTGQASDFLQLSSLLSAGIQEVEGMSLESIRYDARRREIQASILYENYEQLASFKSAVESFGGVVREGGSRQVGNLRAGEITVTL